MLLNFMITAVDFDGTLCEDKWPDIGEPNHDVIEHLKQRKADGHKLILWTCRVEENLQKAIEWSAKHGLHFDAVNENVQEILTMFPICGRKIYYDCLIDNKNHHGFDLPYRPDIENEDMNTYIERRF